MARNPTERHHRHEKPAFRPHPSADEPHHLPWNRRWIEFDPFPGRILWWIVLLTVAVTPLVVVPQMKDAFRLSKDVVFLLASGLLIALFAVAWAAGKIRFIAPPGPLGIIAGLAVAWTGVCTIFSTNRALSLRSFWWVVCCMVFLLLAWQLSIGRSRRLWLAAIFPAVITSIVVILQWSDAAVLPEWLPRTPVGLLGNQSDVGSYLVIAMVVAIAVGFHRSWAVAASLAALFMAAILLSQSITAAVTAVVAAFVVFAKVRPRMAVIAVTLLLAVSALFALSIDRLRGDVELRMEQISAGRWDDLTNARLAAYSAGLSMVRDHPVTGVGPGAFGYQYLPRVIEAGRRLAPEARVTGLNFGEAHNDHLEVIAETGVPGYLLLLAGAVALVRSVWASRRSHVVIGTVTVVAILSAAQFPLQLAGPTTLILFLLGAGLGGAVDD
jgi:O-antigen ligase